MSKKIAKALIGGNWLATLTTQLNKFEVFYFYFFLLILFYFSDKEMQWNCCIS